MPQSKCSYFYYESFVFYPYNFKFLQLSSTINSNNVKPLKVTLNQSSLKKSVLLIIFMYRIYTIMLTLYGSVSFSNSAIGTSVPATPSKSPLTLVLNKIYTFKKNNKRVYYKYLFRK